MTLYFYAACDTCRRARRFLEELGLRFELRPLDTQPPDARTVADLHRRSGLPLPKLFNVSGRSYRALDKDLLAQATDQQKYDLLGADGMLVKRPILDLGHTVLVGFHEETWATRIQG